MDQNLKRHNWILLLAGIFLSLGLFYVIFYFDATISNSRMNVNSSLRSYLFSALLIMPFIEEIAFRGSFLKQKFWFWLSLIGLIILTAFKANGFFISFSGIYFFLLYLHRIKKSKWVFKWLVLCNTALFSIMHYTLEDFSQIQTYGMISFQLFFGLLAIWITLNYTIFKAIIMHVFFNSILISIAFYNLQFPEEKLNRYASPDNKLKVVWKQKPYFSSGENQIVMTSEDTLMLQNLQFNRLFNLGYFTTPENTKAYQAFPFMKYEALLIFKGSGLTKIEKNRLLWEYFKSQNLIRFIQENN